jgi:hypothetical protein
VTGGRPSFARVTLRPGQRDPERIALAVALGAAAVGAAWLKLGLATPPCLLARFAGLPCPGCGATRAARALLAGDFAAAWSTHPLFVAALAAAILAAIYAAATTLFNLPRLRLRASPAAWTRIARWSAAGGLAAWVAWVAFTGGPPIAR